MQRAMDETERRREIQIQHNKEHGIVPKGIFKSVEDILEGAVTPGKKIGGKGGSRKGSKIEEQEDVEHMSVHELNKYLSKVENRMMMAAKELNFEEAARLRDELHHIKELMIKNS